MAHLPRNGEPGPRGAGVLQDARAREEAERLDRHRSEELADACAKVEEELEQLKGRYELYFLGVDRREPSREREELRRSVAHLKNEFTRNTGLRFRIETLHARYLSYDRMWTRSAREKEEGTYRRDLLKARRNAERHGPAEEPAAAPAPPAANAPPARPAPLVPEEQLRGLFAAYLEAKRRCQEDVSRLTYEAMARAVEKQVPELLAKYQARSIEFKVVIKDGRAVLKAVPRR